MIERLELEAFLTLAEELHFGRTAARLNVTTGRISQTVKALERRIGAPLFERTNRVVRLTELGHTLHEDLRPGYEQIQAGLDRATAAVRQAGEQLTIGYVGAAAGQVAHRAAELFPRQRPACRVRVREAQITEALGRLRGGDVDVLLLSLPLTEPDLVTGPVLISEPRMLAVPAGHPLARQDRVTMEDLARIPLLRIAGAVPGAWPADRRPGRTPGGLPIPEGPRFETFQEALQLIGAGAGACIVGEQVTRFYTRPDVACVPFADAPPIEWVPAWLTSHNTPLLRSFARTAQEAARLLRPTAADH
ncbi:LysR substrate-binding domain-containing protein [Kitasatospora sp. NPDC051853]|uniref:LysR substrate-binding domain-containing protein n=1 Tax=Kitasatospora sp. NPDC051853 TaxID=3364058 RepID=UPI0037B24436